MDINGKIITEFPHKIYDEVLKEIIKKNLKKPNEKYDVVYSPGSAKGDNYVGVIYKAQVKDKENGDIKLNLIVKLPPQSEVRREEFLSNAFFTREALFYDDVFPLFKKFQEQKGIDIEKEGFHHVPFCYKTLTNEPTEGLFFEDLKALGFEMYDRLKELSKDHVLLVMKTLARMHAIFYAMKDQNPELVEKFYDMQELFVLLCERDNSSMEAWFKSLKEQTLEVVNKSNNADMKEKINKMLVKKFGELLKNIFKREEIEPYAVLGHGDCWNNNMLFQYDKNGVPNDIRLLDFQIMRYSSPVCDLMYYIFGCTTKALRDKYYQDFLNVYYDELSYFISRLGSDPSKLFPRQVFEAHLKKFGHFGFIMAMLVLPIFTSDADDILDLEDLANNFKKLGNNEDVDKDAIRFTTEKTYDKYAERMMGVCDDMYSLGYF